MSQKSALQGNRQFVWFKPARRRPTEYESYTVGQQSFPEQWLDVDWPVRFDDGRAPFIYESTALKCDDWSAWRDPAQLWQRPYVQRLNHEESALGSFLDQVLDDGVAETIDPKWVDPVLGTYLGAYPFVEYGQFLALAYPVREALSDTLIFATAFQCADKMRSQQDIVQFIMALAERRSDFSDAGARSAWMKDPTLVPMRENIERIAALEDWAEVLVAVNLALEPLAADLVKTGFFSKSATRNGDPVTPMIFAATRRDSDRHLDATKALVRMVVGDAKHGDANRKVVDGWLAKWTPYSTRAADALRGLFELDVETVPFGPERDRVQSNFIANLRELGLKGGS